MKFTVLRDQIVKPLQWATGVVERRKNMPILANILFKMSRGKLSLIATDTEIEIVAKIDLAGNLDEGETTIPGRKLLDLCRALPEQAKIEFTVEASRVILRSDHSRFTLSILPATDFPRVADDKAQVEFSLTQQQLRNLIERTQIAIAQNDTRTYLNGLLLELHTHKIIAVGADGHRMCASTISAPSLELKETLRVLVPRKAISELLRLLDSDDEKIDCVVSQNHIRIATGNTTFTSKLIDAQFPDYRLIMPPPGEKIITIAREAFKQILLRAAILTNDKFRGICLQLRPDMLQILANNPEQEEAEEHLLISYQGADLDIGFNVNYLIDVLNITRNEVIQLTFSNSNEGVLIEEIGMPNNFYVVMPMRL